MKCGAPASLLSTPTKVVVEVRGRNIWHIFPFDKPTCKRKDTRGQVLSPRK
jgi:hypothetical protein